ncbi:MAG: ABC transporter permease [Candidatus Brocadiia bacterium]
MRNALAIARREINAAFLSMLAWTVLTVFLIFSGFFFWLFASRTHDASLEGTVGIISFFFLVAMPLLTMRLLSEEYRSGTIETLMTAPVTELQVILGKFIGALAFYGFMLAPTLAYAVILCVLGKPDVGVMFSSYLGLVAMGCEFIALGLFCSTLTRNQIVAAVFALVALLVLWVMGAVGDYLPAPLRSSVEYLGTMQHLSAFSSGRIAFRDLFYFASMTGFWLFLSVRVLESKRWR